MHARLNRVEPDDCAPVAHDLCHHAGPALRVDDALAHAKARGRLGLEVAPEAELRDEADAA